MYVFLYVCMLVSELVSNYKFMFVSMYVHVCKYGSMVSK